MKMYGYWRSGTTYRARLAIAYKQIDVALSPINLIEGEHKKPEFLAHNPSGAVPTLELDDGTLISQSTAIIEYLEDRFPEPPLFPASAKARARVRHLAGIVACDIHPLQNLRVQKYLKEQLDQPQEEVTDWLQHFMGQGFAAFEAELARDETRGEFCFGNRFTAVECYLLPQLFSARRFGVSVDQYPNILAVEKTALALDFVGPATPDAQPDAQ